MLENKIRFINEKLQKIYFFYIYLIENYKKEKIVRCKKIKLKLENFVRSMEMDFNENLGIHFLGFYEPI